MRTKLPTYTLLLFSLLHVACSSVHANFNTCQRRNGNFPKPGSSCRSYYKCTSWKAIEIVCPEDQHFFPAKGYCVWPEEYPCLEKPKSKECPLPDGKFLKQNTGCKMYYNCRRGVPTTEKCNGELLFDSTKGNCEWPELVTCPEELKHKECPLPNGKFLKLGTGCRIFYNCINGVATEKTCPEDQLFVSAEGKCEWPEIYTCIEEPKHKECPLPNGKFLRPGTGCRIFYNCLNGVATEKRCPEDQLFDPVEGKCEWPEIYTCIEDASTVKTTTMQLTSPNITSIFESTSTKQIITTTTSPASSTSKRPVTDSDEDSSEEKSSEEEKNTKETKDSQEDDQFSTKSKNTPTTQKISSIFKSSTIAYNTTKPVANTFSKGFNLTSTNSNITPTTPSTRTGGVTDTVAEDISTISVTTTSDTTDSVTLNIFCPKPFGHFPHPNNRHQFIACVAGIPTIMDCPADLVYVHEKKSCDYDVK